MVVLRVLAVVAGAALVVWVLDAAIRNFMLPRSSRVRLTAWIALAVAKVLRLFAPPTSSYRWRDKVLALRPALTLLSFQAIWQFLVFSGFSLVFWGSSGSTLTSALRESGSALFTLGFSTPTHSPLLFLVYAEAVIGLTLLALLISYLPTIYAAFQRREFMVAKLANRAGSPPAPWRALAIAHVTNSMALLDSLWVNWEDWFIELAESHTSFTILSFYRSPDPDNHWTASARAVLDLAALRIAVVDLPSGVGPHVMIRSGTIALRTLARHFGIPHDPDPRPDDPISLTREQFDAAWMFLERTGVPMVADRDQAWRDFAGWRVNYDAIVTAAAEAFDTAPDAWATVHETPPLAMS